MEPSASILIAQHTLLSCGLILAVGTLAALLAQRIRIPDVAIFLIAGIAVGPHALGLIHIAANSALNQIILLFGASYILFDGGASVRLEVLKQVWITIVILATARHPGDGRDHRTCGPLRLRPAHCRRASAGSDDRLDRSRNPGADLPADQNSRPGRADRDERIRLQRRHGRDRHLHAIGARDRRRKILACRRRLRSVQAIRDRHSGRHRARLSRGAADRA